MTHGDPIDRDLEGRLRADRPQLSAMEFDRLQQRALSRVSPSPQPRKAGFLKSRLAFVAVLATGVLMSGAGATMAVTGIAGDGDASVSQYRAPSGSGVLGDQKSSDPGSGGPGTPVLGPRGGGDVAGDRADSGGGSGAGGGSDAGQQAATSTSEALPFTGLVVFPLLIGGLMMLIAGAVMRRSARPNRSE